MSIKTSLVIPIFKMSNHENILDSHSAFIDAPLFVLNDGPGLCCAWHVLSPFWYSFCFLSQLLLLKEGNNNQRLFLWSEPLSELSGKGCFLVSGGVLLLWHTWFLPPCITSYFSILILFVPCFMVLYPLWYVLFAIFEASLDLWVTALLSQGLLFHLPLLCWLVRYWFLGRASRHWGKINISLDRREKQQQQQLLSGRFADPPCWALCKN